jgi:hypothetical protein
MAKHIILILIGVSMICVSEMSGTHSYAMNIIGGILIGYNLPELNSKR